MITPVFLASVLKGKLVFNNPDSFDKYLQVLNNKSVDVVIRLPRKDRSNKQNRWYWLCVVGIPAEHFGYLPEEMHEAYKFMFLKRDEEGKPLTVRSSASLSTVEFIEYTENCRQWAAEQGFIIPDPKEVEL
jgi:hypothetical protein